jgi:hypothetical protein
MVSGLNPGTLDTLKNLQMSFKQIGNDYQINNLGKDNSNDSENQPEFLKKQRRRSIKNNKIVFVHSKKKEIIEPIIPKEEEENMEESFEEIHREMKMPPTDQNGLLPNGKKPRGSRYRGVSRNGNQWQVKFV